MNRPDSDPGTPRPSVAEARAALAEARRAECRRLAALVARAAGARPERVCLSPGARRGEPGRWARLLLRRASGARLAATAPVFRAGADEAEAFLTSALLWLDRLCLEPRPPRTRAAGVRGLWLIAPPALAAALRERAPLLREDLRALVTVHELNEEPRAELSVELNDESRAELNNEPRAVNDEPRAANDEPRAANDGPRAEFDDGPCAGLNEGPCAAPTPRAAARSLTPLRTPTLEELLDAPAGRLARRAAYEPSRLADEIVALAPGEIDRVRARRGETLRYLGLPFARVRAVAGREHLWFGVEPRARALFDGRTAPDLFKLVASLKEHRRADAPDRRHALYRAAPEAWLEALLRRDVTRLDPGLRLAPLHAQFRVSPGAGRGARPVDLLALRRDGRLAVIELKVSEDAALPLQGADYWRRVESRRRRGDLARARLFGDAEVSDEPPLVYLVSPLLRFHRSFHALARCVRREVEMYRFDLNEDWRAGVRVARVCALT
ncbi:MAG TPA: hypothetical protein VF668_07390 [Pyrinomonadaceae bacterium]|jgi:hypothetical protein